MPTVKESIVVQGDIEQAYQLAKDMESYPDFMPNVINVDLVKEAKNETITSWITEVDGKKICWKERDIFNDAEYEIIYQQLSGDLKEFNGRWKLESLAQGTKISLTVNFEFGIPMLSSLLHPILKKKVANNSRSMLEAIKKQIESDSRQCS
ncbi:SRPBCC family protein [Natroniella sulfidigena]|uniref:type II toxin-antitoxin system RatA family toxin n=1 Tax=Natroniella sulfidigena TaxID=723921 RepID=UPI00200A0CFA|nr:SRPBCC family protein [Natroniella sulfidigena]MCK8817651.1 SRPBCC family protein [Natroniella sulfidigena]